MRSTCVFGPKHNTPSLPFPRSEQASRNLNPGLQVTYLADQRLRQASKWRRVADGNLPLAVSAGNVTLT